jgi:hypothetical protein
MRSRKIRTMVKRHRRLHFERDKTAAQTHRNNTASSLQTPDVNVVWGNNGSSF